MSVSRSGVGGIGPSGVTDMSHNQPMDLAQKVASRSTETVSYD